MLSLYFLFLNCILFLLPTNFAYMAPSLWNFDLIIIINLTSNCPQKFSLILKSNVKLVTSFHEAEYSICPQFSTPILDHQGWARFSWGSTKLSCFLLKYIEIGDGGLVGTLCATLEELYTERTGPQTHSDRVHSNQFLINFYSHSNSWAA